MRKLKKDVISTLPVYSVLRAVTDAVKLQIFHRGCAQNMLTLMDYGFISKDVVTVWQKFLYILYQVSREIMSILWTVYSIYNTISWAIFTSHVILMNLGEALE